MTLTARAAAFRQTIAKARAGVSPRDFEWYPWDALASAALIDRLTVASSIFEETTHLPMLDVGCADGELALLFESMGHKVTAVDFEGTNFNQMQGVRALRGQLRSRIDLHSLDLDGRFQVPGGPFGVTLLLGILYHLKNPYYLLEYLARKTRYCLLSTRVAQRMPGGADMRQHPIAYLAGTFEVNADPTNYWIFSMAGLERLVSRSGWSILQSESTGCLTGSDPVRASADERAWLLLRSRFTQGARVTLTRGWHDLEDGTYRWTARSFGAVLHEQVSTGAYLGFAFTLPLGFAASPITLTATVNGCRLAEEVYEASGEHQFRQRLPDSMTGQNRLDVEFQVESASPFPSDDRELGVVVNFWREGAETMDDNAPLSLSYGT